LPIFYCFL
jgi:hypothetical protein